MAYFAVVHKIYVLKVSWWMEYQFTLTHPAYHGWIFTDAGINWTWRYCVQYAIHFDISPKIMQQTPDACSTNCEYISYYIQMQFKNKGVGKGKISANIARNS